MMDVEIKNLFDEQMQEFAMAGSSDSFRGKDIQLLTPIEDEMQKL
jgi:hypothetical protein